MTNQEKKVWLLQYRSLDRQINRLEKEKKEWIERATKMSTPSDGMPHGSGVSDTVGFAVSKSADLATEIDREIDKLADLRREIEAAIRTVEDGTMRNLLKLYYIDGYTLEAVADEIHYCYRQTRRLHWKALTEMKMSCNVPLHL